MSDSAKSTTTDRILQALYSVALISRQAYCEGYQAGFEDGINLSDEDADLDKFWQQSRAAKMITDILDKLDEKETVDQPALVVKEVR